MIKKWIVSALLAAVLCKLVIVVFPSQPITSWLIDTVGVQKTVPYQMSYEEFAGRTATKQDESKSHPRSVSYEEFMGLTTTASDLDKSHPPTMTIKALPDSWVLMLSWASGLGVIAIFVLFTIGLKWAFGKWSTWENRPVIPLPTLNRRMRLLACAWLFWPLALLAWAMIDNIDLSVLWNRHAPLFFLPQAFLTLCLQAIRWVKRAPR